MASDLWLVEWMSAYWRASIVFVLGLAVKVIVGGGDNDQAFD